MEIQEVFYWFATIAMALTILFLLAMVGLLFYIKKKITDLEESSSPEIKKVSEISLVTDSEMRIRARDDMIQNWRRVKDRLRYSNRPQNKTWIIHNLEIDKNEQNQDF